MPVPITIARLTAATAGCMLACSAGSVADQPSAHAAAMPEARPRVGLVLAGGGAKGGAHVGVLKVLEELNVPIDCIAGTSMGALVGGAGRRELQTIQQKQAGAICSNEFELGLKYDAWRAKVQAGDTVDTAKISAEAQRMSALQEFESVSYTLTGDPANPTLEWWPQEKKIGPDYLKFDLGLYASEAGDLGFERIFVEPKAFRTRSWEDVFLDGDRLARYRFDDVGGRVSLGGIASSSAPVSVSTAARCFQRSSGFLLSNCEYGRVRFATAALPRKTTFRCRL